MSRLSEREMLEKLLNFNTPTVGNIVATYPDHPNCLGIYDPWNGKWYTNQSVHCIFPEMGRRIGYASTIIFSMPDPNQPPISFLDWIEALGRSKKPTIVVAQQKFPPEIANAVGLFGGQMTSMLKSIGVTGVVTDGPSRDIDEMRELGVQYIMSGVTPSHGDFVIRAIEVPVSVAGMDVIPGELIHMDEHGAVKFPVEKLSELCANIDDFSTQEDVQAEALLSARNVEEIKEAWEKRV
jgi:4-hydroxy-4-methyl-2-oxoglutarate aldolase